MKKLTTSLELLKGENSKLTATVLGLGKISRPSKVDDTDSACSKEDVQRYKDLLQDAEKRAEQSRGEVQQWVTLATRSYNEYQAAKNKLKAADVKVEATVEKDREIAKLKQELQTIKHTNGTSTLGSGDAAYWKEKYEAIVGEY